MKDLKLKTETNKDDWLLTKLNDLKILNFILNEEYFFGNSFFFSQFSLKQEFRFHESKKVSNRKIRLTLMTSLSSSLSLLFVIYV